MRIYRTAKGIVVEEGNTYKLAPGGQWDSLFQQDDLPAYLAGLLERALPLDAFNLDKLLPPIDGQEVWAAGVTYFRSRTARMEESSQAGGQSFYDRVYEADRPELFFKSTAHRTVTHNQTVAIRRDSSWSVPEPELALVVDSRARLIGYTVGNDMSARDIEGANPLYLPQAKVYDRSCSLGPGLLITSEPLPGSTDIQLTIRRQEEDIFTGATRISEMKRSPEELIEYLFRQNSFPRGCFLLTGTGIVPPNNLSIRPGDTIRISIEPIGTLINQVE
ncbi:MAG: 2-hydroxyhepta-2,4-diene-1,7-dioate isomerase [Acidobacteria bacterium]|nr:MAG: 2-hydroxyhepta-2,4-diene-1,7-dioate isomerase [Acidobacteriota bacterium]